MSSNNILNPESSTLLATKAKEASNLDQTIPPLFPPLPRSPVPPRATAVRLQISSPRVRADHPRGSEHGVRGGGGRWRHARAHGAEPPRAGHPQVGLRRRQGRRREDHVQLYPLRPPRLRSPICARHLHRPRPQPQRRLPAALHQVPHTRPRILQPLRHGEPKNKVDFSSSRLIRLKSALLYPIDSVQFVCLCEDWIGWVE
jgi:hypothetical protein